MPAIMRSMNVIARCAAIYRTQQIELDGLLGVHHSYILVIVNHPGMSQDWLAKHLCLSKSNVTRHLACLEKQGYVERRASEADKREMLVYPTQKMIDIYPEVLRVTHEWNALISEGFSEEELEGFGRLIEKMLDRSLDLIGREG
ncbi:MAG: MarR family transcriptional regulator [Clostridia bacterium]|nr:MarR family transcriptional regulator [Clostridia bacterium]